MLTSNRVPNQAICDGGAEDMGNDVGIRYIGSKARIAEAILDHIGAPQGGDGSFIDGFAGTGAVAQAAASRGWNVVINDSLLSASVIAASGLVGRDTAAFSHHGGYEAAVAELNAAAPVCGFVHATYSPASAQHGEVERRYFTEANAAKIDATRAQIRAWSDRGLLTKNEETLLLADLLTACNRVANTAGTYGCFLRNWSSGALRPLVVQARQLPSAGHPHLVLNDDVVSLKANESDVLYLDPPYTKRQYAAYYHILETIAHGDTPSVGGVTGLRPWRDKASDFCYKTRAHASLIRLIERTTAGRIHLSYSSEGHVELGSLVDDLSRLGAVMVTWIADIGRYRPNRAAAAAGDTVSEYLLSVDKLGEAGGLTFGDC